MAFEVRTTDELIRILLAGGGLSFDASLRSTDHLVRMALAARQSGCALELLNLDLRSTDELVRIALAGSGRVHFK
jgi:hypothetical protein